jgi:hypothetical protein
VEGLVEAEEEEVVVAVAVAVDPQGDLPDAHQAVPLVQERQVAHWAVPDLEAFPHSVADPAVPHELAKSAGSLDRKDHPPSPRVPVRVLVLASWEGSAGVGSLDPLLVGTAEGAVATTDQPPVEAILSTRWSRPWQKGRNWEPLVVVSPSGSMFVGLVGG